MSLRFTALTLKPVSTSFLKGELAKSQNHQDYITEEKDPKKYSVKYLGPEKAAAVLEKALQSVKVYNAPL